MKITSNIKDKFIHKWSDSKRPEESEILKSMRLEEMHLGDLTELANITAKPLTIILDSHGRHAASLETVKKSNIALIFKSIIRRNPGTIYK